ncbi:MAG: DUF4180 domain-containing protein [Devosia sp.]|uniref:DUF4180 domain-containing protein n=1 Tax=Devosia sp. TaxID=1871048 RepID=UPI001AC8AC7D|nr:DUF4180 domain-containing protein [Devosia sp.]MBN9308646.1 DUF4180 domain-containing protein [Devosia sp.]MBN9314294.1 DUF4180 domain-containing protein [Devosia sp.]
MRLEAIGNTKAAWYDGPRLASEGHAVDVIGDTYGQQIDIVLFPVELLADDFFWLSTGLAGAVLQKFQNYGLRVGLVGDISRFTTESPSLRDFVNESNRRGQVLFVPDRAELEARL